MIIANLVITSMLTCLIWIIQILHYPSFKFVRESSFTSFEAFHTKSISLIVMPLMIAELLTISLLILKNPQSLILISSLVMVVLIWLSTFYFSIPCHNILSQKHDIQTIEKLIMTNWPRTILWSSKFILAICLTKGVIYE
jgi:hypothetical protein